MNYSSVHVRSHEQNCDDSKSVDDSKWAAHHSLTDHDEYSSIQPLRYCNQVDSMWTPCGFLGQFWKNNLSCKSNADVTTKPINEIWLYFLSCFYFTFNLKDSCELAMIWWVVVQSLLQIQQTSQILWPEGPLNFCFFAKTHFWYCKGYF